MSISSNRKSILVVGAGIAGAAVTALLGRAGHDVTLVERDGVQRTSGSPVDLRGEALRVMSGMGLLDRARRSDTGVRSVTFVDAAGRAKAQAVTRGPRNGEVEISRSALGGILLDSAREVGEVVLGDGPVAIDLGERAGVEFDSGRAGEYDLVVGADGQHSTVRRLAWGAESQFATSFGLTIATVPIPAAAVRERDGLQIFNEPGRSLAIHPAGGKPVAAFIFRDASTERPHGRDARLGILQEIYGGTGWRTAEMLDLAAHADDLYYDTVTRIRTPSWSRGPATLLGDAAGSLTILGEGSSMALVGAARLTAALAQHDDQPAALRHYEQQHRTLVEQKQRGARAGVAALVPKSRIGIELRDLIVRVTKKV